MLSCIFIIEEQVMRMRKSLIFNRNSFPSQKAIAKLGGDIGIVKNIKSLVFFGRKHGSGQRKDLKAPIKENTLAKIKYNL